MHMLARNHFEFNDGQTKGERSHHCHDSASHRQPELLVRNLCRIKVSTNNLCVGDRGKNNQQNHGQQPQRRGWIRFPYFNHTEKKHDGLGNRNAADSDNQKKNVWISLPRNGHQRVTAGRAGIRKQMGSKDYYYRDCTAQ